MRLPSPPREYPNPSTDAPTATNPPLVAIGLQAEAVWILIEAAKRNFVGNPNDLQHIMPHLEAAYKTLNWFKQNEHRVKNALRKA